MVADPPRGYLRAGVLVPLIATPGSVELLFTKRTEHVETHKGQISFPGGVVEDGDRDIVHTALREAEEELGVERADVEPLGLLEDLTTPTGFVITPVLGLFSRTPHLRPNPAEVAEVFTVPLDFFADPASAEREFKRVNGRQRELWKYQYGEHLIWGATAMIIRSLLRELEAGYNASANSAGTNFSPTL
jgi:8-oxo-dGTP pyrophosphatase MutT (NUDIX family)